MEFSVEYLFKGFIIGLTASLSFLVWFYFQYANGIWVTITILIIMEDSLTETNKKAWVRFLGQTLAALIGGCVAIFFSDNIWVIGLALGLGFFICGMIIGSGSDMATIGNHAGSALAIMLLAGTASDDMFSVVLARFFNVLLGLLIATLVIYFFSRITVTDNQKSKQ